MPVERKGLIAGVVALIAVGVIAFVALRDGETQNGNARIDTAGEPREARAGHGTSVGGAADPPMREAPRPVAHARSAYGDGGVPRRTRPARTTGESTRGQLRRDEASASRSAGWRLGQARARIDLVQTRVTRLQEAVAELEGRGQSEAAERQRVVLRRFETRLGQLREEETELEAQATQDGTIGEVEQGMREGLDPAQLTRPPAQAGGN